MINFCLLVVIASISFGQKVLPPDDSILTGPYCSLFLQMDGLILISTHAPYDENFNFLLYSSNTSGIYFVDNATITFGSSLYYNNGLFLMENSNRVLATFTLDNAHNSDLYFSVFEIDIYGSNPISLLK